MESKEIKLSLKEAKLLYNSGNSSFKSIALKAYTESELTQNIYTDIYVDQLVVAYRRTYFDSILADNLDKAIQLAKEDAVDCNWSELLIETEENLTYPIDGFSTVTTVYKGKPINNNIIFKE